jgi:hypothetical protein
MTIGMNSLTSRKSILAKTVLFLAFIAQALVAQREGANYDESKVGSYLLPDPLTFIVGRRVKTVADWTLRRKEILALYQQHVHGVSPVRPIEMTFAVVEQDRNALSGKAIRKQIVVNFFGAVDGPTMNILLYLPRQASKAVPCFLGLSFSPLFKIYPDPSIRITDVWDSKQKLRFAAPDTTRGTDRGWEIDSILARGYGVAIIYYCDIEPDFAGGLQYGVRSRSLNFQQASLAPNAWGAIGAWAWGLSRAMDYLETDKDVDAKRIVAIGHSRLGKTALWAAAQDERFAGVIASCSGEMGGALSRRNFGETVDHMIKRFPYQFSGSFAKYLGRVNDMPVDAHLLLSLIAPRPVFLSTGSEDQWADPRGEFLAEVAAGPVYELLGARGLGTDQFPPLNVPIMKTQAFRCHTGKHEVTVDDWNMFLKFADTQLGGTR